MRLCDRDILAYLEQKKIVIEPPPALQAISGVSVDLRLGYSFRVFVDHTRPFVDISASRQEIDQTLEAIMSDEIELAEGERFFLHPGELALAVTLESITLPNNVVGWLDGRSSLARLGLMVHVTAHRIDPGWSGVIVLECFNSGKLPLALQPNMVIGAINFELMSGPAEWPYNKRRNAKYKNQQGAVGSRISQD